MKFILEFKSFYNEGDVVLIEYWYNDMLTPVRILEKLSKVSYKVTHDAEGSKQINCSLNLTLQMPNRTTNSI